MSHPARKKKERHTLPATIRNELRLSVILRACNRLKTECDSMTKTHQQTELYTFFHGKDPGQVSHINLLYNAISPYDGMFEDDHHAL